jgi:hypothetical protein
VVAVAGGLMVVGTAHALPTNNYTGPRWQQCGDVGAEYGVSFVCSPASANASQSSTGGINLYEAAGNGGTVTQTNTTGQNIVKCDIDYAASSSSDTGSQLCDSNQSGNGGNTVIADIHATQQTNGGLAPDVTFDFGQTLKVVQQSDTGPNTVRGLAVGQPAQMTISQTADSGLLGAGTPANQSEETLALANIDQRATTTGNNSANIEFSRFQSSVARGASPRLWQDIRNNGTSDPNGKAYFYQRTGTGSNYVRGRGVDEKYSESHALDSGVLRDPQQYQWHSGGGWDVSADVDSTVGTNGGTVDLGTPFANGADCRTQVDGWKKLGTIISKAGLATESDTTIGDQRQIDGLPIRLPGQSPQTATAAGCTDLRGGADTVQATHVSVDGHADGSLSGAIAGKLTSNGTTAAYIPFNAQTVHVSLDCTRNTPNTCTQANGGVTGSGTNVSATQYVPFTAQVATFTNANPSKPVASATINWGDETAPSAGTIGGTGSPYTVGGSHTYKVSGTLPIEVVLKYGDGTEAARMSSTATVAPLSFQYLSAGSFVVGDKAGQFSDATKVGSNVTFWADQWAATNPLTSGQVAPYAFKGFENTLTGSAQLVCKAPPATWLTKTGNSPPPPAGTLPHYMATIVASSVSSQKSTPTGNIVHMVIIDTTGTTYAPSPSGTGTGVVAGVIC